MVITIDFHADILCPWCYLQKKSLDRAMERFQEQHPDAGFNVRWKPFYLYPALEEGMYIVPLPPSQPLRVDH